MKEIGMNIFYLLVESKGYKEIYNEQIWSRDCFRLLHPKTTTTVTG